MDQRVQTLRELLFPRTASLQTEQERRIADMFFRSLLLLIPLSIVGVAWLLSVTDWATLRDQWLLLLIGTGLIALLAQMPFFVIMEREPGVTLSLQTTIDTVVVWGIVLILGPTGLWPVLLHAMGTYVYRMVSSRTVSISALGLLVDLLREGGGVLTLLLALLVYQALGGIIPLEGLISPSTLPALVAIMLGILLSGLVLIVQLRYLLRLETEQGGLFPTILGLLFSRVIDVTGIVVAAAYAENGLPGFLSIVTIMGVGSYLSYQLSRAVDRSRQQSRAMQQLEQLGRAIINATPPSIGRLSELIQTHAVGMLSWSSIDLRLFPHHILFQSSVNAEAISQAALDWLTDQRETTVIKRRESLPWSDEDQQHGTIITTPILKADDELIGAIYVELRRSDNTPASLVVPVAQTLAAQIASAVQSAETYQQTLENQRLTQELEFAGRIQASFLPEHVPSIPGWEFAADLVPARQTSGDFYDVIDLPDGKVGLVIADVADKGTGSALFMALTRTLIRTYAIDGAAANQHGQQSRDPCQVFDSANERILNDTHSDLFVTAFYAVLDLKTGRLTYANGGHNPPLLLRPRTGERFWLARTGLPLGLFDDRPWSQQDLRLEEGDVLILYTDGVTEAQNAHMEQFGEDRLTQAARELQHSSAQQICSGILSAVQELTQDELPFDDITLVVVRRTPQT
ncbi:MAG: SpoIIE family protein phosphatase [Chloroflexi bacterium]|nr:SpoIIE family protein phosphatase [Chloroflexota bacterium]